jgi:hypothetical protein
MKTISCYCARCNQETEFAFGVGTKHLEFIGACQNQVDNPDDPDTTIACGHTVKFPNVKSAKELQGLIAKHNTDNKIVVTANDLEADIAKMESILEQM